MMPQHKFIVKTYLIAFVAVVLARIVPLYIGAFLMFIFVILFWIASLALLQWVMDRM